MTNKEIWHDLADTGVCLVQHVDGGIYKLLGSAQHTDDQSRVYVYVHLWPFEVGQTWVRPASEWLDKFQLIVDNDYAEAKKVPREEAQAAVMRAKAARRAAEAEQKAPVATEVSPAEPIAPETVPGWLNPETGDVWSAKKRENTIKSWGFIGELAASKYSVPLGPMQIPNEKKVAR